MVESLERGGRPVGLQRVKLIIVTERSTGQRRDDDRKVGRPSVKLMDMSAGWPVECKIIYSDIRKMSFMERANTTNVQRVLELKKR